MRNPVTGKEVLKMQVNTIRPLALVLCLLVVILLVPATVGYAQDREPPAQSEATAPTAAEEINWQVISSGGTDGNSTNFKLVGTLGQTGTGYGSSTDYGVSHGFWQGYAPAGCCGRYTGGYTGNTNCDPEGRRNLADITQLISRVYITPETPLCCEENGNTNGVEPINLADITRLIDHVYISHSETAPCP
jgi:hypothetical protein